MASWKENKAVGVVAIVVVLVSLVVLVKMLTSKPTLPPPAERLKKVLVAPAGAGPSTPNLK